MLLAQTTSAQKLALYDLTCEHKTNPVGVDVSQPRLSWKINSNTRNCLQAAYSVRVSTTKKFSSKDITWQSGKIISEESILQSYNGTALQPGKRYYWQVKVWDADKNESAWSEVAFWETGLLSPKNWQANWIEPKQDTSRYMPAVLLRNNFGVAKKVASARAYVTAHGFYELYIKR